MQRGKYGQNSQLMGRFGGGEKRHVSTRQDSVEANEGFADSNNYHLHYLKLLLGST